MAGCYNTRNHRVVQCILRLTEEWVRVLIVSDIHSNIEALDAVLRHAERNGGF